jgi:hypothetical protein
MQQLGCSLTRLARSLSCSCARLGLTSLGYLWRRDQEELLEEMIDSGIEAIIVKVASIGLQPRKHLGRTITDLQMEFLQLVWCVRSATLLSTLASNPTVRFTTFSKRSTSSTCAERAANTRR